MTGYVSLLAPCFVCRVPFMFNPVSVPSMNLPPPDGTGRREPICRSCFDAMNEVRRNKNLEPWPEPAADAYTGAPESEVTWND